LNDDGVKAFVVPLEIVGSPGGRIVRNEARRVATPIWQGEIGETAQVKRGRGIGHGGS